MRSVTVLLLAVLLLPASVRAQGDSAHYRIRPWVDIPICVGSTVAIFTGLQAQNESDRLTPEELAGLKEDQVPFFDRGALHIDPTGQDASLTSSDHFLNGSAAAPLLLLLDRRVRREWLPVFTLYVEAATITGGIQTWGSVAVKRYRPIAYIPTATEDQRTDSRNIRSFYSGHTANAAVASFFMAKVLDDLHPELGRKRWWLYGAAVVPPALVGWYRIQGGKHFPSDVVVGGLLGAAAGVLVPELHRRIKNDHVGIVPLVAPDLLGLHLAVRW
jgi:membrane-associated phospholipid phosphatase